TDETSRGRYAFVSLGCPKNLVDSERMLGLLQIEGYELIHEPAEADFVVVNTCGFIEQAREESFGAIDEMLALKAQGKTRGVIVTGCLAERQREKLLEDRPEIDALIGVFGREEVTRVADRLIGNLDEQRHVFKPAPIRALSDHDRLRITPKHFAYLKISEGCDRLCTFCAIPKMRGKHASKPLEDILNEARQLAESGVRELIVVAQDTTYYARDIYGESRLTELLQELDQVEGIDWIRLMYFYPMYVDDRLIQTIADSKRIVPYIDMPLQHASDEMLRRMSRRVNLRDTEKLIGDLRSAIPDLTLRTTFITGFPGETEANFNELADFVERQRFERMGVFTYSYEPDTPAAKLPNHIDEAVKLDRQERLMAIQQQIAFEQAIDQCGTQKQILIDSPVTGEKNVWIGRTHADAPDVDSLVFVTGGEFDLRPGALVDGEIVTAQGYDLIAIALNAGT
ncbi:MAG: 30S ribosomal protein S12 methylthiotransferase RimO, partial [bacterium]|nr:30S ribosomal protein S12 methylthiotransferase RimO [bacterium]